MLKIRAWLNAARLRTLPLSLSGVIMGTAIANFYGYSDILIFILALLTTIAFQVISNFANDYGDGMKGTDNDDRIGPKRALQSGLLSPLELKRGIALTAFISVVLVIVLVYRAFGTEHLVLPLVFLILGGLSIWAAIRYTVGKSAYGYQGFGDLFVFLFFGLLAVIGSFFLYTKQLRFTPVLPAIAIGALSAGVLNLNNLRDYRSDKKANKNTLVVKIGFSNGKRYHYALLIMAFVAVLVFVGTFAKTVLNSLPLLAFVPIAYHFWTVLNIKEPVAMDPELKKLALSTFLLAVLTYITYNKFL